MTATQPEPMFTELSARRLGPVRTFFVRHPVVVDVLVMAWFAVPALLMAVVPLTLGEISATPVPEGPDLDGFVGVPLEGTLLARTLAGLCAVALATVALFWRRHQPVLVLAVVTALGVVTTGVTGTTHGFELAVALTVYAVAASRRSGVTWLSFGAATLALGGALWCWERSLVVTAGPADAQFEVSDVGTRIAGVVLVTLGGLFAVAIGTSVRGRRQHIAELISRANALARDRDQQAALARAAERSRIAREMHDVVAHSLSVMIALADGAGAALTKAPERSRLALDELSATGRSALADMRRVLGVLDEPETPFEPQPDSQDLGGLVDRFRAAGLAITSTGLATPLPADAGLQLAVYRIVQEALTNTLRHAPGTARADVTIERTDRGIEVTVTDQGPGLVVPDQQVGSGRGVIGMRERVGVYGGVVEAGPWGGGWRVHAVLPWAGRSGSDDGARDDRDTSPQRAPDDALSPAPGPQTAVGPEPVRPNPPVTPRSEP